MFREGFETAFSNTVSCFVFKCSFEIRSSHFEFLPSVSCAVMFPIGLSSDLSLHSYEFPLQLGGLVGASFYVSNLARRGE